MAPGCTCPHVMERHLTPIWLTHLMLEATLHWPDCHNARDIGGLRLSSGGRVRAGALIRSDSLDRLTPAGLAAVKAAGISRIIDLRSAAELAHTPSPFAAEPIYTHRPYIDEVADRDRDPVAEATQLATYQGGLARNGRHIAAAIVAVATAPAGPVVVHCAAGKDRTGVVVAVILDYAGVAREEIAADYALTATRLRPRYEAELAAAGPANRAELRAWQSSRPKTILATLAHMDSQFGSAAAYLARFGVSPDHLRSLHNRLIDA